MNLHCERKSQLNVKSNDLPDKWPVTFMSLSLLCIAHIFVAHLDESMKDFSKNEQ